MSKFCNQYNNMLHIKKQVSRILCLINFINPYKAFKQSNVAGQSDHRLQHKDVVLGKDGWH